MVDMSWARDHWFSEALLSNATATMSETTVEVQSLKCRGALARRLGRPHPKGARRSLPPQRMPQRAPATLRMPGQRCGYALSLLKAASTTASGVIPKCW
jgi:hypothetical protein